MDPNLLPNELRVGEKEELSHPPQPTSVKPDAILSSKEKDRVIELDINVGLWSKIKSWFNKDEVLTSADDKSALEKGEVDFGKTSAGKILGIPTHHGVPLGVVLDVNLLPVESRPIEEAKRYGVHFLAVAGAAILVVIIGYAILLSLKSAKEAEYADLQREAEILTTDITGFNVKLNELKLTGRRMKVITEILSMRSDWLKFFDTLEGLIMPNVSFTSLSLQSSGNFVLGAEGKTVSDLAKQFLVFQEGKDIWAEVEMAGVSLGSGLVEEDSGLSSSASDSTASTTFELKLKPGWLQAGEKAIGKSEE